VQIFISWSGTPARELAEFLQHWLQKVIQELDPFVSNKSIEKGSRWSPEIAKRLSETSQAIVCVTSENQQASWLNFEAGALAKATDSRVRTLLVDIVPSDVTGPLSEFQHTIAASKEDVWDMIEDINANCDRELSKDVLRPTFDREWPDFEAKIAEVVQLIATSGGEKSPKRETPELLAEILDRVRAIERTIDYPSIERRPLQDVFISGGREMPLEYERLLRTGFLHGSEQDFTFDKFERMSPEERSRLREYQMAEGLLGRTVEVRTDDAIITGVVERLLGRGTGVYLRIKTADASITVPLGSIVSAEGTEGPGKG